MNTDLIRDFTIQFSNSPTTKTRPLKIKSSSFLMKQLRIECQHVHSQPKCHLSEELHLIRKTWRRLLKSALEAKNFFHSLSRCQEAGKDFKTPPPFKRCHWLMPLPNVKLTRSFWISSLYQPWVKISSSVLSNHSLEITGLNSLRSLELIMFMKSQWEEEPLNKHLTLFKVNPRWKAWTLTSILLQRLLLRNSSETLHSIGISIPEASITHKKLKLPGPSSTLVVNLQEQETFTIGK